MRIRDYIGDNAEDWFMKGASGVFIICGIALAGKTIHSTITYDSTPVYRDVNGDGIKDKVTQRLEKIPGILGPMDIREDVLFGTRINGRTVYLDKEQFDQQ